MIRNTLTNNSGEEFSYVSARPIETGIPTFIFFHATGFNGQTYWPGQFMFKTRLRLLIN